MLKRDIAKAKTYLDTNELDTRNRLVVMFRADRDGELVGSRS